MRTNQKSAEFEGIDILVSFDTTGSMYPCLAEVRRKVSELVEKLFAKISGLRMGVIAHGDYCDQGRSYVIKMLDLTSDRRQIVEFVKNVGPTDGGDREVIAVFGPSPASRGTGRG